MVDKKQIQEKQAHDKPKAGVFVNGKTVKRVIRYVNSRDPYDPQGKHRDRPFYW